MADRIRESESMGRPESATREGHRARRDTWNPEERRPEGPQGPESKPRRSAREIRGARV